MGPFQPKIFYNSVERQMEKPGGYKTYGIDLVSM